MGDDEGLAGADDAVVEGGSGDVGAVENGSGEHRSWYVAVQRPIVVRALSEEQAHSQVSRALRRVNGNIYPRLAVLPSGSIPDSWGDSDCVPGHSHEPDTDSIVATSIGGEFSMFGPGVAAKLYVAKCFYCRGIEGRIVQRRGAQYAESGWRSLAGAVDLAFRTGRGR